MPSAERDNFLQWYESMENKEFDFQKEMLDYIRADVTILREAIMKFRDIMMDVTATEEEPGIDPFAYLIIGKYSHNKIWQHHNKFVLYSDNRLIIILSQLYLNTNI